MLKLTGRFRRSTPARFGLCPNRLSFGDELRKGQVQRLGDGIGRIQTWVAQTTLNDPNVRLMESCPLRERLPAQLLGCPMPLQHQRKCI